MFISFEELDKHGKDITAIVIYLGKSTPKQHNKYEYGKYGTKLTYQFNSYLVAKQKEEELIANPNPFAIVVLANLYTLKTQKDLEKRLTFKEKVYEIAQSRNYSIEKTTELFIFVKDLMQLGAELEAEYDNFIIKHKKEEEMRVASKGMQDFMNRASIELYGRSIDDTNAELQKSKEALKFNQEALKDKEIIITRSIINLKDKMNLTASQIASILDIDVEFVNDVLSKLDK